MAGSQNSTLLRNPDVNHPYNKWNGTDYITNPISITTTTTTNTTKTTTTTNISSPIPDGPPHYISAENISENR